jgi:hypothetical protein
MGAGRPGPDADLTFVQTQIILTKMGNDVKINQIPIPSRESITDLQVHTLLNIAGLLTNYLLGPGLRDSGDAPRSSVVDGGVLMAAETTFVRVCNRLDLVLGDDERWSLKGRDTLENKMVEMYDAHKQFTEVQTNSAYLLGTPHARFRPSMARIEGGYAVFLGPMENPLIVGVGENLADALYQFDQKFMGELPAEVMAFANRREKELDEHEKLDQRRVEQTDGTEKTRRKPRGNRKGPRPLGDEHRPKGGRDGAEEAGSNAS